MLTLPSVNVSLANNAMNTPLLVACYRENIELIYILVNSGRIPQEEVYAVALMDNVAKGVPKNAEEDVIFFSNAVNEVLVKYTGLSRPKLKQKYMPLRIGIQQNVNTMSSLKYAAKSHPSCLTDANLQNLYTRLKIPPRTAILQQESLLIVFASTGSMNISHHSAFTERILTPEPFVGTIAIDYTAIGGEGHICAYLFMHNKLFLLDTGPSDISKRRKEIVEYIREETGITVGFVDVAGAIQKL